jgi:hypothetical protein
MTTHSIEDCKRIVELDTRVKELTTSIRQLEQFGKGDIFLSNHNSYYGYGYCPYVSMRIDATCLLKALYSVREAKRNELIALQQDDE